MKDLLTVNDVKPKSVIIEGNLHTRFKLLCKGRNLKIGGVIENLISLYLDDPKKIQGMIEDLNEVQLDSFRKER